MHGGLVKLRTKPNDLATTILWPTPSLPPRKPLRPPLLDITVDPWICQPAEDGVPSRKRNAIIERPTTFVCIVGNKDPSPASLKLDAQYERERLSQCKLADYKTVEA
jgi:hypothetical protein